MRFSDVRHPGKKHPYALDRLGLPITRAGRDSARGSLQRRSGRFLSHTSKFVDPLAHPPVVRAFPVDAAATGALRESGALRERPRWNAILHIRTSNRLEQLVANDAASERAQRSGQIEANNDFLKLAATICGTDPVTVSNA